MTLFDRIKDLSNKRNKNIKDVATELGFSENLFYKWKTSDPKGVDLEKVADYFNVSVDYLLGREEKPKYTSDDLEEMIDNAMSFNGKPLSDHDREVARAYLEGKFGTK
jgi:transcriptional regulator with XRE-family HTH domain